MENLVKFDEAKLAKIDGLIQHAELVHSIKSEMQRTFDTATIKAELEKFFTPEIMTNFVMPLMNSDSGFRTDRDPNKINKKTNLPFEPYPVEVVKRCVIDGLMQGVGLTNNQMNIIAERLYITKEGFCRKLNKIQGLKHTITPGIPKTAAGGALVDTLIQWNWNGKENTKNLTVCVKLAENQGADVAIGKATRKARAWLFQNIAGYEIGDGDEKEDGEVIETTAETVKSSAETLFEGKENV